MLIKDKGINNSRNSEDKDAQVNQSSIRSEQASITLSFFKNHYPNEMECLIKLPIYDDTIVYQNKLQFDEDVYIGECKVENGKLHGRGFYLQSDGGKYMGYYANGYRNGRGRLYDKEGNKQYDGNYEDDNMKGGVFYFSNGKRQRARLKI